MSESQEKKSPESEDLTYGDIVWGQFQKNKVAVVALGFLSILCAIAIFCPIVASDRPFIWTENGETSYPWFTSLFDRNYYESSVDIFFNLAMVVRFFSNMLLVYCFALLSCTPNSVIQDINSSIMS